MQHKISRRAALLGGATALLTPSLTTRAATASVLAPAPPPDTHTVGGWLLGCQAYSFNRYSAFEAIERTAQAGGRVIEFFPGQKLQPDGDTRLDQNLADDAIQRLREHLDKNSIRAVAYGVVGLGSNETESRTVFDFARKLQLLAITSEPAPDAFDTIEKLVRDYDIKVGIHNHPRQQNNPDYRFWDPNYVLSLVKDRDKRIGSCADTGHWIRSNIQPTDALRTLRGRVISSHLKDLDHRGPGAEDVPFGTGVGDIPGVLRELKRQGFSGNLSIEYESHWENNVPDIAQCIGFVRGLNTR